jgi:hypothetical protein
MIPTGASITVPTKADGFIAEGCKAVQSTARAGMIEALRWAMDEASRADSVNDAFQCIQEELVRLEKL